MRMRSGNNKHIKKFGPLLSRDGLGIVLLGIGSVFFAMEIVYMVSFFKWTEEFVC